MTKSKGIKASDNTVTGDDKVVTGNDSKLYPLGSAQFFTFSELGQCINEKSNTLSARWNKRLSGWVKPYGVNLRVDRNGRKMLTREAAELFREYKIHRDCERSDQEFERLLSERYSKNAESVEGELIDDDDDLPGCDVGAIELAKPGQMAVLEGKEGIWQKVADVQEVLEEVRDMQSKNQATEAALKFQQYMSEELDIIQAAAEDKRIREAAKKAARDLVLPKPPGEPGSQ